MRLGSGDSHPDLFSKVPLVTFTFWVIKILATTVGETGGDALSMTLKLGYAESSFIFFAFFAVTLTAQMLSKRYRPLFYWAVVVATTTFGTTTSDYLDRTLGLGYVKSSIILFCTVCAVLAIWHYCTGSIRVDHITSRANEALLLAHNFGFQYPGHRARRFRRDKHRIGVRARSLGFFRLDSLRGDCLLPHQAPGFLAVLGGLRFDQAAWGHARRYPNEISCGKVGWRLGGLLRRWRLRSQWRLWSRSPTAAKKT